MTTTEIARRALRSLTLAAVSAAIPVGALAQAPDPGADTLGWAPVSIGVHAGWDNEYRQEMIGAQVRIPVLPDGSVELIPNADITFLPGLKDYQVNLEAVYLTSGREGGLYLGGGIGRRSSIFESTPGAERETVTTYSIVAGVKIGTLGLVIPQAEVRWIFPGKGPFDPRPITLGVNVALWRP